jgi:hypothetical protein
MRGVDYRQRDTALIQQHLELKPIHAGHLQIR